MKKILIYSLIAVTFIACSTTKKRPKLVGIIRPQIIYKTTQDFSKNVPIQMNNEKTKITGFPAPSDLKINGELQTPIKLEYGFFYDRRGISINTVFLKITYEEYSKLKKSLSVKELEQLIIDKNPFSELYYCPNLKQGLDIKTMNSLVKEGFPECQKILNKIK